MSGPVPCSTAASMFSRIRGLRPIRVCFRHFCSRRHDFGHVIDAEVTSPMGRPPTSRANGLNPSACARDNLIDCDQIRSLAREHKPKLTRAALPFRALLILQQSRRSRMKWGPMFWAIFLRADCGGEYPSPFPHCHVATTTTHKTLRGPRGGMILTNDEALAKKVQLGDFPGIQGDR